jgi:hypothetical protein
MLVLNSIRTQSVNSLFAEIPQLVKVLEENKKGNLVEDYLFPNSVPRTGIEPALPCDNQILSLARLPIPPSGQTLTLLRGRNITHLCYFVQNALQVFFSVIIILHSQQLFFGSNTFFIIVHNFFNIFVNFY